MSTDILLVFAILIITILLFVSDRLRLDLVAMMALLALLLSGILSPAEALAGFADPIVIMIAGLFVVSGGLFQTGVADRLGAWLSGIAGSSETRLILLIMAATGVLSGFMSSTGTVAVMLPVVVSLAWRARISPSKLLIPLAFASLLGGMLTLIGTPPNIVVSNQLRAQGLEPFGFFSFTPFGLVLLALGMIFMVTLGRRLLPDRASKTPRGADAADDTSLGELAETYSLPELLFRVRVKKGSPLVTKSLAETELRRRYRVNVLGIVGADEEEGSSPGSRSLEPATRFRAGDTLLVQGERDEIDALVQGEELELLPADHDDRQFLPRNLGLVEVLLTPRSRLIGKTLRELRFRDRYRVTVVSVKRAGETVGGDIADTALRFGDSLLVKGPWKHIHLLRHERRDFVVVAEPRDIEAEQRARRLAPMAVAIMAGMMLLLTFEIVPAVTAVLVAAVLMVLTGCLNMEDAYRAINWESVVLIAGILPMATALEKTGGMQLLVDGLLAAVGGFGPVVMMAGLFVITSAFSQVISNTATTVLVAPIAFQAAISLGVSPHAFLMTVAIAASTSFATPIASPVNTLVLGPGAYRFTDFTKIGIFLQVFILLVALLMVPLLLPLGR